MKGILGYIKLNISPYSRYCQSLIFIMVLVDFQDGDGVLNICHAYCLHKVFIHVTALGKSSAIEQSSVEILALSLSSSIPMCKFLTPLSISSLI